MRTRTMTNHDEFWTAFGIIFGYAFEAAVPIFGGMWIFVKVSKYFADKERARK